MWKWKTTGNVLNSLDPFPQSSHTLIPIILHQLSMPRIKPCIGKKYPDLRCLQKRENICIRTSIQYLNKTVCICAIVINIEPTCIFSSRGRGYFIKLWPGCCWQLALEFLAKKTTSFRTSWQKEHHIRECSKNLATPVSKISIIWRIHN